MTDQDKAFGCVRNTIRLRSGIYFDLADPKPEQIEITDIAGALSKICRFGGHCYRFYSVAEHCYHCSMVAEASPLALLLHDAAEAFTGDIVKPLKIMLPEFAAIERRPDDSDLVVLPSDSDVGELGFSGFAEQAARELSALAQQHGPQGQEARDALGLLHRLARAAQ